MGCKYATYPLLVQLLIPPPNFRQPSFTLPTTSGSQLDVDHTAVKLRLVQFQSLL